MKTLQTLGGRTNHLGLDEHFRAVTIRNDVEAKIAWLGTRVICMLDGCRRDWCARLAEA